MIQWNTDERMIITNKGGLSRSQMIKILRPFVGSSGDNASWQYVNLQLAMNGLKPEKLFEDLERYYIILK